MYFFSSSKVEFSWKARHHWAVTEDYRTDCLEVYCSDCNVSEHYPISDAEMARAYAGRCPDVQICWWVIIRPEDGNGSN